MDSKYEIRDNLGLSDECDDAVYSRVLSIDEAMDEYAKQIAIDFGEFVGNYENGLGITPRIENDKIVWYFVSGESVNKGETSVVWELYLQSKK